MLSVSVLVVTGLTFLKGCSHTQQVASIPLGDNSRAQLLMDTSFSPSIYSSTISSRGMYFAVGCSDGTLRIWNLESGQLQHTLRHPGTVSSVSFSPDEKYVATACFDNVVRIWDVARGNLQRSLVHGFAVYSISFTRDGKKLGTSGLDRVARIWDLETGTMVMPLWHECNNIYALAFTQKGNMAATGGCEKYVRIWDLKTGETIQKLDVTSTVTALTYTQNGGHLIAGCRDGNIIHWEPDGKVYNVFPGNGSVPALAISPDNTILATAHSDAKVRLWNIKKKELMKELIGHGQEVTSIVYCNNSTIATGSEDRTIRLWNTVNHNTLAVFTNFMNNEWVVTTTDGRFDGSTKGIQLLSWKSNEQTIPLHNFSNFYTRGLLSTLIKKEKSAPVDTDISRQLIGKIGKVNNSEIIVYTGRAGGVLNMGDEVFIFNDQKKIRLTITFPMMTLAKCRIKNVSERSTVTIKPGMPVFR